MGIEIKRVTTETIQNDQAQPVREVSVTATVKCDGPKCQKTSNGCLGTMSWTESKPGEGVPDDAWRIITLATFSGEKYTFFSPNCLKEAMRSYVPPLSPKEKAAKEMNNAKVDKIPLFTESDVEKAANGGIILPEVRKQAEAIAVGPIPTPPVTTVTD